MVMSAVLMRALTFTLSALPVHMSEHMSEHMSKHVFKHMSEPAPKT